MEFPLWVIRVRLDLHHRRLDSGGIDDPSGAFDVDIGQPDRSGKSLVDKAFHRGPGLLQRDAVVVHDGPVRVAGVLVVAGLEGKGRVHQVQIDRVEPEPAQAGLQRGLDPLGAVVVVPQLGGHKQVLAADRPGGEQFFERLADRRLVAISLCGVEMAEAHLDRGLDGVAVCVLSESDVPNPSAGITPLPLFKANVC